MAGAGHKAKKELEAARKSGILPPEQDAKTGELINPHIPEFMAKAPWYLSQGNEPTLAHQRKAEEQRKAFGFETYYRRGEFSGQATVYRKGACKNCGSMSHKEKDCVERPRAVGAWKTGKDIAPDEIVPANVALDWDSKRDRWAGYSADQHNATIERYEAAEEERKRIRAEQKAKELADAAAAKEARRKAREEKLAARKAEKAAAKATSSLSAASRDAEAKSPSNSNSNSSDVAAGASLADGAESSVANNSSSSSKARPADDAATASEVSDSGDSDSDTASDTDTDFSGSDDSNDSDADVRERDNAAVLQQDVKSAGTQKKMTVRNLRVREDTAKYLYNLDTNSAYYDPKTRSMRENPFEEGQQVPAGVTYRGDAELKRSGAASEFAQDQVFAWDASEAGADGVHLQANPTQLALLKKQYEERKAALVASKSEKLRDKYGAAESVEAIPAELRMGQAEGYVEFTRDGRPVKGPAAPGAKGSSGPVKSRYTEDAWPGNHTSVFGSWYDKGGKQWGFACCHSTLASSWCTGAAGKAARAASENFAASAVAAAAASSSAALSAGGVANSSSSGSGGGIVPRSSLYGEQLNPSLDPEKLKKALERYERQERSQLDSSSGEGGRGYGEDDDEGGLDRSGSGSRRDRGRGGSGSAYGGSSGSNKRGYNSLAGDADVSQMGAEDVEAYKIKRIRTGDPMAGLLSSDKLLGEEEG